MSNASESQDQLRLLLENMEDMVCRQLPDSTILYVSPSCRSLTGFTAEELVNTRAADYVHPDDVQATLAAISEAAERHDGHYRGQHRMKRKDGEYVWVEAAGRLLYGPDGSLREIQCVVRDITERKRAEELLAARVRLSDLSTTCSSKDVLRAFLDEIERLTGSAIGFFHFLDDDQKMLLMQTWSTNTLKRMCPAGSEEVHYPIDQAGVWVDCVRERRPVIHNDYASLPHRKGLPEGHMPVIRELVVPVFREEKIVAILGVGNKQADYDQDDLAIVTHLADMAWDIVQRKQAEEALGESEERYRAIAEDMPVLIRRFLPGGEITHVNEAYCRCFQKTSEELVGQTFLTLIPEADRETVMAGISALTLESPTQSQEHRVIAPDGEIRWQRWTNRALFDARGRAVGYQSIGEDITEHKQAEEEAARFSRVLEESLNEIYIFDAQTLRFVKVNYGARENLGYSMEELYDLTPLDLKPEFTPELFAELAQPLRTGKQQKVQVTTVHQRKDGTQYPVEVHLQLMTAGTPVFVSIILDITERKQAEKALKESELFLRETQSIARVGGWKLNPQTDFLAWTEGVYSILEAPLDYKPGFKEAGEFHLPEYLPVLRERIQRCYTHGDPFAEECQVITNSGKLLWTEVRGVARLVEGKITYIIGTFQDITERKRAEREREALIAKLEIQNAELERFTYTVSHDLKSPLITIKGYVGMLRQDLPGADSGPVADDLARISNAADKMDKLLRDLLELSRIGQLVNPPEDVSLEDLAREARELVHGQAEKAGVQVEIRGDLPIVFGDRVRLLEVLQNLIDNGVKYRGDQPRPRIEIGSRRDGNQTVCYVRDNGIGIEPRYHEKVFGLFDQLNQNEDGTGIGLALSRRIVEVHGGRIWVESEGLGHGSTFCFTIAAKAESPQSGRTKPSTDSR